MIKFKLGILWLMTFLLVGQVELNAQQVEIPLIGPTGPLPACFNSEELARITAAVDLALKALAEQQQSNGSFKSVEHAQPGATSLAVMAYLSRGHRPGIGPYGEVLTKGVNYVLTQQRESGIFSYEEVNFAKLNVVPSPGLENKRMSSKTYNHAISLMMLGEVYGMAPDAEEEYRIREAIKKGLKFTIQLWDIRKSKPVYDGGFRYTRPWTDRAEGDMSATGWHVSSLRSLKNAGFDVPESMMQRIGGFVRRCQNEDGGWGYLPGTASKFTTSAAGALCYMLSGEKDQAHLMKTAQFLEQFRVERPEVFQANFSGPWPYYTSYYMSQMAIHMGGRMWIEISKQYVPYLLENQLPSGFWPQTGAGKSYGSVYSTSMAVLALTPVFQVLPIYQR